MGEVGEAAAHGEGRGGEHPGALLSLDIAAEGVADVQRRLVQHETARGGLEPQDGRPRRGLCGIRLRIGRDGGRGGAIGEAQQPRLQLLAAPPAALQSLAAFGHRFQVGLQFSQGLAQHVHGRTAALPGRAAGEAPQGQAKVAHGLFQRGGDVPGLARVRGLGVDLQQGVAAQIQQLAAAEIGAEEVAGHLRQLVGLVEDEGIDPRQHLAEALIAQGHVGEEQVVVDHQHLGRLRRLARLDHEAVGEDRAFTTQAVVGGGGNARPDGRVLGDAVQLGDVAALGAPGPAAHARQLVLLRRGQAATGLGQLQAVRAEVVGAALEQGDGGGDAQRLAHRGQVAVIELILQVLGAGGDEHLLPAQ